MIHQNLRSISMGLISTLVLLSGCTENKKEGSQQQDEKKMLFSQEKKFKVGQVWKYHNRDGEDSSTITILKIEKYDNVDTIIHIRVDGVRMASVLSPTGYTNYIQHMPYSQEAVYKSVTTLVGEKKELPDFSEGYNLWKEAWGSGEGGIITIPVKEMVQSSEDISSSLKK